MTGSGLACQLCLWASGENIIAQVQVCILCNSNLRVQNFALFCTRQTLVEGREMIESSEKSRTIRSKHANNHNKKGKS